MEQDIQSLVTFLVTVHAASLTVIYTSFRG